MEDIRVSFITYNVGTSNPEQSLLEMLGLPSNPKNDRSRSDLYVVGFQEVKSQPQNIFIDAIYNDPWTRAVQEILASRAYIKLKTIRLQGLVLSLFCRRRLLLEIRDVETTYVRTGLAGMWGNKGAVGIRISISGCSLCFVNAHLSAHESQIQNRIKDYNDILKGVKFHDPITEDMFSHDYIFWMGDLNFRLRDDFTAEFSEIDNMIRKGDLKTLFQYDELQQIMREGVGLHEFSEGHPDFAPTFKFKVGSQEYDDKRKQAWTDRILYKVNERNYDNVILKAELVKDSYRSHPFYLLSDHKPVTADFVLKVFANYSDTYVLFERIESWVEEQDNVVTFEVTKEFPFSKNDWIGAYREDFSSIEDYLCYEYVSKGFSPLPAVRNTLGQHVADHQQRTSRAESSQQQDHRRGGDRSRGSSPSPNSRRVRSCRRYTCTFSGPPSAGDLAGAKVQLVYVHQTEDNVVSVLACSNPFLVLGRRKGKQVYQDFELLPLTQ